jgi:hypothetical protein
MKRYNFIFLFLLFAFYGCSNDDNKKKNEKAENDIDAAREFIRSALDGKFTEARAYILADSVNLQYLDVVERSYQKLSSEKSYSYKLASINIHKVTPINDSITVVIFSNSYMNDRDTLKILKQNGKWLVDLKYLYEHDMDAMHMSPNNRDSLK